MNVITVKRTIVRRTRTEKSATRPSFREVARCYFPGERSLEFVIEALLFAIIVAISVWPILDAANALSEFLQNAPG